MLGEMRCSEVRRIWDAELKEYLVVLICCTDSPLLAGPLPMRL